MVNFAQPGLARTSDGVLHVIWVQKNLLDSTDDDILHAGIAPDGTVGAADAVETGWAGIWEEPDLITTPEGGLRAFFGGIRSIQGSETNKDLNTATAPSAGTPWTLTAGSVVTGGGASSSGIGAASAADGTPFQSWSQANVHRGLDPSTPFFNYQDNVTTGCCGYDSDLAIDGVTGQMYVAWYSNATGYYGEWAQEVDTSSGAPLGQPMQMPGVVEGGKAVHATGRAQLTGRPGLPGVYLAHSGGYPTADQVLLWKIGGGSPTVIRQTTLPGGPDVAIASTPDGRIWVAWVEGSGEDARIKARLSDTNVNSFGPTLTMKPPPHTTTFWGLSITAQDGLLDVVVNVSDADRVPGFWHSQQIAPILGGPGDDRLLGSGGPDTISGLGGNDFIDGRGGNDDLFGGAGKDEIIGGSGNDLLLGGGGNDLLKGGKGKDVIKGGKGKDTCIAQKVDKVRSCERIRRKG